MFESTRLRHFCLVIAIQFATLLVFHVLQPICAFAQAGLASVSGRVTDQTNAVMPDVEVEIKNVDTGVSQITKTNGDGFYSFPELRPGNYLMSVRKQSFQTVSVTGISLNVQDNLSRNFVLQVGSSAVSVTVTADKLNVNMTDALVSTVIDRQFVENLPLNGRSFNTLLQLTPGVVIVPPAVNGTGQFSISGQRSGANTFSIDGVSANFGVGLSATGNGTGAGQAFSVLGGTSSLVSVEALEEFRVETSSYAAEFGHTPGGQVILTTRSGTNDFHGGLYEYFRNDGMDANDWFLDRAGKARAPERHNDFGGFLGGPILKNRTFFFVSYEGARLRLPQGVLTIVPSEWARTVAASPALAPYLNAYPQPDNRAVTPGLYTSQLTAGFSNAATLNATSIRIDQNVGSRFSIFGRYNYAPSQITTRPIVLSSPQLVITNTQTLTVGTNMVLRPRVSNTLRGNYSMQNANNSLALDSFGGAVPVSPSLFLGPLPASNNEGALLLFDVGFYALGPSTRNKTEQADVADDLSLTVGSHQLKFGGEYRAIYLHVGGHDHLVDPFSTNVQSFLTSGKVNLTTGTVAGARLLTQSVSLYGQDVWKPTPKLALTYGLRWELNPAPSALGSTTLAAWTNTNNPAALALAPTGTSLYRTTYDNFAPRVGIAYRVTAKGDLVVRGGWGLFYDLGANSLGALAQAFPNNVTKTTANVPFPVSDPSPFLPVLSLQPPFTTIVRGFSSDLILPRSYQWNIAVEKSFGDKQVISATYVGQAGRDLLRQEAFVKPNSNFSSDFELTVNDARSNYNALEVQYRRPLSRGLQALLNYTWSHSLDNASNDQLAGLANTAVVSTVNDYASADFDVRHSFSGALSYQVPHGTKREPARLLAEDWFIDTVIVARTGFPFNGLVRTTSPDPAGTALSRPDLVAGQPFWIANPAAGDGKSLNPNAFAIPSTIRQGTEGRNDIPGFGLTQVDVSFGRKLFLTERLNLQLRADAFNVLNHPNFTNPTALIQSAPVSLQSQKMLNQGLGASGLNPLFEEGGPRSLQVSLKLIF